MSLFLCPCRRLLVIVVRVSVSVSVCVLLLLLLLLVLWAETCKGWPYTVAHSPLALRHSLRLNRAATAATHGTFPTKHRHFITTAGPSCTILLADLSVHTVCTYCTWPKVVCTFGGPSAVPLYWPLRVGSSSRPRDLQNTRSREDSRSGAQVRRS